MYSLDTALKTATAIAVGAGAARGTATIMWRAVGTRKNF